MYKRLTSSLIALLLALFALAHPSTASARSPNLCSESFCESTCPSDLASYCTANLDPTQCPGSSGNNWRYKSGFCMQGGCPLVTVACSYSDP